MSTACPRSQSAALDSSTAPVEACWGETRRRNKGLVRKGRSGLIESFGSSLHWSGTCYRDPVSWFPNNEISEKGICCPLGFCPWSFLCFFVVLSWLSGRIFYCLKSDYCNNMEACLMPTAWITLRVGVCWLMTGACLSSIWITSLTMLSLQSNKDVPLLQNIFRR